MKAGDVVYAEGASAILGDVVAVTEGGVRVAWRATTTVEGPESLTVVPDPRDCICGGTGHLRDDPCDGRGGDGCTADGVRVRGDGGVGKAERGERSELQNSIEDLCDGCCRDMQKGEPHTAECPIAYAQDVEEGSIE